MLTYKDDLDEQMGYLNIRNCMNIQVKADVFDPENKNHNINKSVMVFTLNRVDERFSLYIENFQTFKGTYNEPNRNKGYGTFLLTSLINKLDILNLSSKIIKISGTLDIRDLPYWKFSLPMYYSFSRKIIGPKVVCLLNNEPTEKDNLVSTAYNINSQNIAMNFEFAAKDCFSENKKSPPK